MKKNFFKKALSVFTAMAIALSLMTGIPFSELGLGITVSAATTEIDALSFAYGIASSGTGWTYDGSVLTTSSGYELTVTNGTFTATVYNNGTIVDGIFSGTVYNDSGIITGGTFEGVVNNNATISGGVFNGLVTNNNGATIENASAIFSSTSVVDNKGIISNGTFDGSVTNRNIISNGTFNGSVDNNGTGIINSGDFNGTVTNRGTVNGGDFTNAAVSCEGDHHIERTPATCQSQAVCDFCGQSYGSTAPHNFVDGVCSTCSAVASVKYTYGGTTCYTDDFMTAITAINDNGGGTITLRNNVAVSGYVTVSKALVLDLGAYTLDLGISTLTFGGSESSIIGTGTIKSAYDSMNPLSGQAVYVVGGASLTIGAENGNGPTITGDQNAITTANTGANELTVYAGTFNGTCHFDSDSGGDYNILIKGGTFNNDVYANWTQIDGGVFKGKINCVSGSHLIINDCESQSSLLIGQANTAIKYVTLNGGVFEGGIENQTADGKTTAFLGTERYYIDENGQIIEIDTASDVGYDIAQHVIIAPVHTVIFETNGYGGTDFEKQTADGFTVAEPSALADSDMSFGGWYKDSACTVAWSFASDKITSDTTIYAKWIPNAQVEAPVFTPASGTSFSDELSVTISSATVGAEIFYTTDGTAPTASSTKYTGAITLSDSTTIKAIAVMAGMSDSAISSATYTRSAVAVPVPPVTTEATTDAVTTTTEITTEAPEDTEAPDDTEAPENTEAPDNSKGENAETGVSLAFAGVIASAAAVALLGKRRSK